MATEVKKLQFSEGTDVGAPTDLGLATSTTTISAYADDAAFVSANGAAANGDVYLNSTTKKFRMYIGSAWRNVVPESDPTDATKLFLVDVSGNSTGVSVTLDFNATSNRTVTFTDESQTVANIAGTQTFTNKTIDGGKFTNGFDVPSAGNATIGASVGANNLTLGGATTNVVIPGNLNVQGTSTTLNTATLDVEDTNITLNDGGNDASAEGAGLTVERTSTNGSLIYEDALASKWKAGAAGSEVELANVSSNQTLTNKRVNLSTTAAANDTTSPRLVLPANTYANLSAISGANHLAEGSIYWASDVNKAYLWDGSALTEVGSGSGSGGINYITNSDFETDTTGWGTYKDTAGLLPVYGTGGTALYTTISRNTTTPLRGTADLKIAKSANNAQGEGVSFPFTIDYADSVSPKVQQISFDYRVTSAFDYGTFSTPATDPSDVVVYIYDVTNAQLIQPTPFTLDGSGRFNGTFQNNASSTSYRLIFHIAGTNASAWDFFADNISVGPQIKQHGFAGHDPKTFTPTGSWTTNTAYKGNYSRVGNIAKVKWRLTLSGAPTATTLTLDMIPGLTIDTSDDKGYLTPTASGDFIITKNAIVYDNSASTDYQCLLVWNIALQKLQLLSINTAGTYASASLVNETTPITFAANDTIEVIAELPIVGWSSNTLVSSDADARLVAARFTTNAGQNFATGSTDIINFEDLVKDTHGAVSVGASWKFTAPVSGDYLVSAMINFASTTNWNTTERGLIGLYKNGALYSYLDIKTQFDSSATEMILTGNDVISLNAGDYIDLRGRQETGSSLALNTSGTTNYVSIVKQSGPATIAASEVVAAKYKSSSGQTMINNDVTTLINATKLFDTHNAYNTSTGVFTAPIAGIYSVSSFNLFSNSISWATTEYAYVRINKNSGSEVCAYDRKDQYDSSNTYMSIGGTTTIFLNAGDTIKTEIAHNMGSNINLDTDGNFNWWSIHRIGGVM